MPLGRTRAVATSAGKSDYCTFAVALDRGTATEKKWVASTTPKPIGVGMLKRKGTSTRVPEIGASVPPVPAKVTPKRDSGGATPPGSDFSPVRPAPARAQMETAAAGD